MKYPYFNVVKSKVGIQNILKLRYQVLVLEYNFFPENNTHEIADEYDFYSKTIHIGAFDENSELIGSLRIVLDGELGFPSKDYLNFQTICLPSEFGCEHFQKDKVADIGRLVIAKNSCTHQLKKGYDQMTSYKLIAVAHSLAKKAGVTMCCAISNPRLIKLFLSLGYLPMGSKQICNKNKLPFIPIIGEVNRLICHPILDL